MRTTKIAHATPFSGAPRINLASIFGASSKKPFLLRIPATGERPIEFSAKNLPDGLKICDNIIVGAVEEDGVYEVILTAKNSLGEHTKKLTLEIAPNNVLITPLLGFTTWNAFAEKVTQNDVLDTATVRRENAVEILDTIRAKLSLKSKVSFKMTSSGALWPKRF